MILQMEICTIPPNGQNLAIVWFRQDLRLHDNPALHAAAAAGPVLPVYILDDDNAGEWKMGGASRWWLHHSLSRLNEALHGQLLVLRGDCRSKLARLCERLPVRQVCWNRCYEPWHRRQDERVAKELGDAGIETCIADGSLLLPPWRSGRRDGSPYAVFKPFHDNLARLLSSGEALASEAPPRRLLVVEQPLAGNSQPLERIEALALKPRIPWDAGLEQHWTPGETAAHEQLAAFFDQRVDVYRLDRDSLGAEAVSKLSPYLHFGEISPRRIWLEASERPASDGTKAFLRQLAWREFSHHLLWHFPHMSDQDLRPTLANFPWRDDAASLRRWQQGTTGIPLVDAGMRELWRTGTMHNRARMVTASLLSKNLLIHWLAGARWFWDCLVDADLANNSFGWQWVAGCGADAAPYFRIFNPVLQSRKFDPQGNYLKRWLPELRGLPDRHVHAPWEASPGELRTAGVRLDENYPAPIIDLRASRERALAAWQALRRNRA